MLPLPLRRGRQLRWRGRQGLPPLPDHPDPVAFGDPDSAYLGHSNPGAGPEFDSVAGFPARGLAGGHREVGGRLRAGLQSGDILFRNFGGYPHHRRFRWGRGYRPRLLPPGLGPLGGAGGDPVVLGEGGGCPGPGGL